MELLLNLAWILLCLPAWWVFRRNVQRFSSAQAFLSLACVLVILFPVISATDDLHAAPQATEETSSNKRTLGTGAPQQAVAQNPFHSSPARLIFAFSFCTGNEVCGYVHNDILALPDFFLVTPAESRPPPSAALS
jgi:hypothetical protein